MNRLNATTIVFGLVMGLALALRLWAIDFGLPYLYDPDEPVFVGIAVGFGSGDLNPHWFGHPGSPLLYGLFSLYGGYFLIGKLLGIFPSLEVFAAQYRSDPTMFYLMGRLLCMITGLGTIYLLYRLGRSLRDERVGLAAAFFLAVSARHVQYSKLIRTDLIATFFVLLALLWILQYLRQEKSRYLWMSAIAAGLSISSKYTSGIVVLPVLLASLWATERKQILKYAILASLVVFLAFAFSTPYFFLDLNTALKDLHGEAQVSHAGYNRLSGFLNHWWYIRSALGHDFGVPLLVATGIGIALSLWRRPVRDELLILSFPVAYLIGIGFGPVRVSRWMIPILPFACLYASVFVLEMYDRFLRGKPSRTFAVGIVSLAVLLLGAIPLWHSIDYNRSLSLHDTRTFCREWIINNLPKGSKIAQEWYTAQFTPHMAYPVYREYDGEYRILKKYTLSDTTLQFYEQEGYEYLIVSSSIYARFYAEADRYAKNVQFYESLAQHAELIKEIEPDLKFFQGPTIRIYRLKENPA